MRVINLCAFEMGQYKIIGSARPSLSQQAKASPKPNSKRSSRGWIFKKKKLFFFIWGAPSCRAACAGGQYGSLVRAPNGSIGHNVKI